MTDFDYEVLQKKRLAYSARHKVNGAKSRKCSLPSDRMTRKEREKMNGEIASVNLNKPMKWEEFKNLPLTLKTAYIDGLINKFGNAVGYSSLGRMFGVSYKTVTMWFGYWHLPEAKCSGRVSFENKQAFTAFCNGEFEQIIEPDKKDDTCKICEAENALASTDLGAETETDDCDVENFSFVISGEINLPAVYKKLSTMLGKTHKGRLQIMFGAERSRNREAERDG